jgi:hypothetical protein
MLLFVCMECIKQKRIRGTYKVEYASMSIIQVEIITNFFLLNMAFTA